ncbi:Uncharacterised protein [Mycobacterium tuberculosis]|uniref:Uncharacterized protein n=1 Tax=Mycobacterium tuberculosis TaxID=1773 RepID=A0A654TC44_MYCTX|nr:Uncharacterised protein [Mycobacterium tuberculosis]CFE46818.1 Uncharacterised protein [Mycobacterium tuberculosis]CKR21460.1 Uncharacterised protein [Mycobacterium tuberculosis]CKR54887.1 Uncharacterised protein [Mycobacterium tuberculosis]CKR62686.1 Uncharacterised protein [Mycobacterium tuberculosis]
MPRCFGVTCAPTPVRSGRWQPKSAGAASTSAADHSSGSCSSNYRTNVGIWSSSRTTSSSTDGRCRCSSPSCSPCIGLVVTSPRCRQRRGRIATTSAGWPAAIRRLAAQCGRTTSMAWTARLCYRRHSPTLLCSRVFRDAPKCALTVKPPRSWPMPPAPVASRSAHLFKWLGLPRFQHSPVVAM